MNGERMSAFRNIPTFGTLGMGIKYQKHRFNIYSIASCHIFLNNETHSKCF